MEEIAMEHFWYAFAGGFAGTVTGIFGFAWLFVYWDTRDEREESRRRNAGPKTSPMA
jgi:hypothetical protein